MTAPIKEPTDAEISAKTGFGEPAETTEEATDTEEVSEETEEETDETVDSKEEDAGDKPAARQKRDVSKTDNDEEDDSDDSEEDSEEGKSDEEDDSTKSEKVKGKRTVPYSLLKAKNQKIKDLETELTNLRGKKEDAIDSGDEDAAEDVTGEIESVATKLAEELGMDKDGLAKILKAASALSSKKSVLPKEVMEKLKTLDALQKKSADAEEAAHFNAEWDKLDVRKQYPNASKSAIKEAQELMDTLAHSKEHHTHDLDYILYKNKAKFDTLLKVAPKGKSGESTKRVGTESSQESSEDSGGLVDIENLTPDVMKRRDQEDLALRAGDSSKDYAIYDPKER